MKPIEFPTLYKKTSTGAIQYWTIRVHAVNVGGEIETEYGQLNTDKPQVTHDTISEGKNTGKKNATTALQQAEAEAQAKYEKQLKKGYVTTIDDATNDKVDDLIEGGVVPMLAHKFAEQAHKIKYPAFVQPKLDGIRCIAIVKDGVATLWSRTRKPITSCPHIVQELEAAFETQDIILDGELYNHEMKSDFEKIVSLVRQKEPGEGHEIVQYHIYDTISDESFKNRNTQLKMLFDVFEFYSLVLVPTEVAKNEADVLVDFEKYVKAGYEGAMLRNVESNYSQRRSMDLQKMKPFIDDDFLITGVTKGRGKMAGLAIFSCAAKNGNPFEVKLKGELESLRKYMQDESLWKGKKLTVRYFGLTNKEKVPRFPVGIAVRDYE